MSNQAPIVHLCMFVDDVANAPVRVGDVVPAYSVRKYRDESDRENWVRIWAAADPSEPVNNERFDREFGTDQKVLRERILFLLDPQEKPVGTCTIWWDDDYYGRRVGKCHWMAVVPEHQHNGCVKNLVIGTRNTLLELGHNEGYIWTQAHRPHAIKLYLSLGYVPDIKDEQQAQAWDAVLKKLNVNVRTIRRY